MPARQERAEQLCWTHGAEECIRHTMDSRGQQPLGQGASGQDVERPPYTLPPWNTRVQEDTVPLNDSPYSNAFALHSSGIPGERPSRRKRLLCFALVAFAVVAAVVAAAVVASDSGGSPAPAAGLAASGSPPSSSSGSSARAESDGSGRNSSAQAAGAAGAVSSGDGEEGSQPASLPPPLPHSSLGTHPPHAGGAAHARGKPGSPPLPPTQPSDASAAADGPDESLGWNAGGDQWGGGWAGGDWEEPGTGSAPAPAPAAEAASSDSYKLRFLAVGDWGRRGEYNQSDVAALMGQVAALDPPAFVVSTGDNFYDHGLQGAADPLFQESFMDVYTADSLQVPWYAVLGNHDYCDSAPDCDRGSHRCKYSPLHQMNLALARQEEPRRWHLQRSYTQTFAGGRVQLFFIDTNPFIKRYYDKKNEWSHCPGGLWTQSWEEQVLVLEQELAESAADWKIAIGHHPTYSNGHHGNNTDLVQHLEPLFLRYGVQAYFTGHDHNLEHLTPPGYNIIVTGAGSETGREQVDTAFSRYYHPYSGFVAVTASPDRLEVEFHTLEAGEEVAHAVAIDPSGAAL